MNNHNSTTRFSDRVEAYIKYRPNYPDQAIDWLLNTMGISEQAVIADIGSGTGILTRSLLDRGRRVLAVEPNRPMRLAAEQALVSHAGFISVDGAAEATTLAKCSVDLITAAQSYHWFDSLLARVEFARILRPGGKIAMIWNDRETDGGAFACAYEALLCEYATDYDKVNHQHLGDTHFRHFFTSDWLTNSFTNQQCLDREGLVGRVVSSSYMPGPNHKDHPHLVAAIDHLFERHALQGKVQIDYKTTILIGCVTP